MVDIAPTPAVHDALPLPPELAATWLERWDRQQEHYLPQRTERFDMIADAVATATRTDTPLIVDLGIGPGSLSRHLLERIPGARVVGIDADPLLMALAAAGVGTRHPDADGNSRLRVVDADLRDPSWLEVAGLERAPDAYVSTTALHWLTAAQLRDLIHTCSSCIAPGGVFVDGDHIYLEDKQAPFDAFTIALGAVQSERRGVLEHEVWEDWWAGIAELDAFEPLLRAREGRLQDRGGAPGLLHDYLGALDDAGFAHSGVIWQFGDDRVIAGIAHPGSAQGSAPRG